MSTSTDERARIPLLATGRIWRTMSVTSI